MKINKFRRSCALAALAAACWTAVACGQPDSAMDYTSLDLDELMGMDVVYGASRYEQKLSDAPASVTVITAEEIRAYGYRTLGAVLASVRGLYTTCDRSYEYIGVRGFGRPGDYNSRVLILIDGHAANDLIYSQASMSSELALDLALVQRIEVIRGPGSALYGASAFFAVINILTVDGDELDGVEAMGEAGSFGRLGGRVTWGGAAGGDGSLLLSAGGFTSDGEDLTWPEYDDPATNDGLFVDGDGESALHVSGKYRRGGLSAAAGYTERTKGVPTGEWDMIFNDNGAELFDSRFYADAAFTAALSAGADLGAHLAYDRSVYRGDYPYDYADEGDPLWRVVSNDLADGRWLTGDLHVAGTWGARHRLLAGGDFRKALMARQKSWDPYEVYLDIDERVDNAGIFVQDEVDLGRGVSLHAGLRFDTYASFGGLTTPRLGLVVHPLRSSTLKVLYGEAFRAPNAYELYYTDGLTQKGDADLEPEHIRTWELVWEQAVGPRVTASVSLFRNGIHDLIDQVVDPADSLITFANRGEVCTTGAELELDGRMLAGLRGRAAYSYQQTEDEATGEPLSNSPEHIIQASVTTPCYGRTVAAGLDMRHVGGRQTVAGAGVGAYTEANLTLMITPGVDGLQVDTTVYNLFDEAFADPGAEHQRQDSLQRPGRRFGAKVTWRW